MGADHDHLASARTSSRRLTIALCLTSGFLIAEVVAGLVFNSLALLSDEAWPAERMSSTRELKPCCMDCMAVTD